MTISEPSPVQRFFGGALIVVGFLMMLLCGGCGAVVFVMFLVEGLTTSNHEDGAMVILPILLGGIPAGIGLGLFVAGRSLRGRQSQRPNDADPAAFD